MKKYACPCGESTTKLKNGTPCCEKCAEIEERHSYRKSREGVRIKLDRGLGNWKFVATCNAWLIKHDCEVSGLRETIQAGYREAK
jgi:hypothetical protein